MVHTFHGRCESRALAFYGYDDIPHQVIAYVKYDITIIGNLYK